MKYRNDIECLRAFSVLAVILYHASPALMPGGFIGVDVFFVISGFLMTGIIVKGTENNRFDVLSFYGSRIRRIYPALLLCIFIFYVLGFYSFIYFKEFDVLKRAARSAILGISNIYFYSNTDYFDIDATSQIFLHTWSLGVELQFYILYPVVLLCCARFFNLKYKQTIFYLLLLSFVCSCYFIFANQKGAFYLLPSRVWEFMIGACLAVNGAPAGGRVYRKAAPWLGFIIITAFSLYYDKLPVQRFPGPLALIPCLAAALFILGGQAGDAREKMNRPIINPFFAFIGNLSYSLYLYHWPVLVLYRGVTGSLDLSAFDVAACLVLTFVLSYCSWRFVETPLRRRLASLGRAPQLAGLACALGVFPLLTVTLQHADPVLFEKQRSYLAGTKDGSPYQHENILGDKTREVRFLLLGDSHAAAFGACFSEIAESRHTAGRLLTVPAPLLHTYRDWRNGKIAQPLIDEAALGRETYEVAYIIMRWTWHVKGYLRSESLAPQPAEGYIHYSAAGKEYDGLEALSTGLDDTIQFLLKRGTKKIYLLLPVPEQPCRIPQNAGKLSVLFQDDAINAKLGVTVDDYLKRNQISFALLQQFAERYDAVSLIDPAPLLRSGDHFRVVSDGRCMYYDDDHLSVYGTSCLSSLFSLEP